MLLWDNESFLHLLNSSPLFVFYNFHHLQFKKENSKESMSPNTYSIIKALKVFRVKSQKENGSNAKVYPFYRIQVNILETPLISTHGNNLMKLSFHVLI